MKKLLSLLSTITITSSGIAGIVANSPYPTPTQEKIENINFNDYFFKHIQETNNYNIYYITFKKDNEIYLGTLTGAFILDLDNNEMKKIEGVPNTTVWTIAFNKNNNDTYFATEQGVYLLKSNENIAKKINGTEGSVRWIVIDSNNVGYFSIYGKGLFKWENNVLTKYNNIHNNVHALGIDNEDNLYVGFWNINQKMCVIKKGETEPTPLEIPAQNIGYISFNNKDNSIYIGGTNNIYILKDLKINKIINCEGWVMSISVSLDNNEIFFTTHYNGNFIFYKKQNKIIKIEKITTENSRSVTVDKYNNIYFATHSENKGVYVLKNINYLEKNFKKDLDEKQTEINQLKTEQEQLKSKNNKLIQESETKLTNLNSEITDLKNKLNDYEKKISDFEQDKIKSTQDLITKQNENNQLKTELEQTKQNLEEQVSNEKDTNNKLTQDLTTKQTENNQLKTELEQLKSKNNKLIQESETKLTNLNSEITDLKNKLNDADKKISDFEQDKIKLITGKELLINEKNELEALNKELQKQINELKINFDLQTSELIINLIKEQIRQLETTKINNQKNIDKKNVEINKLINDIKLIEDKITVLKTEKENLNKKINQINDEKNELEKDLKLYKLDNFGLIEEIKQKEIEFWNEYAKQDEEIENLKTQLKQFQENEQKRSECVGGENTQ